MPKQKDRIIIDTNVWISFLLTKDYSKLDALFAYKELVLLFSDELLREFIEVIQRPKFKKYFSATDIQNLLIQISRYADFIAVTENVNICRDPKDNFLLALAKDGRASHLITGDKDLLELKRYNKTLILTLPGYLLLK